MTSRWTVGTVAWLLNDVARKRRGNCCGMRLAHARVRLPSEPVFISFKMEWRYRRHPMSARGLRTCLHLWRTDEIPGVSSLRQTSFGTPGGCRAHIGGLGIDHRARHLDHRLAALRSVLPALNDGFREAAPDGCSVLFMVTPVALRWYIGTSVHRCDARLRIRVPRDRAACNARLAEKVQSCPERCTRGGVRRRSRWFSAG